MTYRLFAFFNLVAALSWVGVCMGAGYAFGNVSAVKEHFELVVVGIIGVSLLPIAWGFLSSRLKRQGAVCRRGCELGTILPFSAPSGNDRFITPALAFRVSLRAGS